MIKIPRTIVTSVTLTVIVGMIAFVLLFLLRDDGNISDIPGIDNRFSIAGADGALRTYSDVQLGLPDVIQSHLEFVHPWTRFSTAEERLASVDNDLEEFYPLRGHERERKFFEMRLQSVITDGLESLSDDLDTYDGVLAVAFQESMEECAKAHGIESGGSVFLLLEFETDRGMIEQEHGRTYDELVALRHSCATTASNYPSLEEAERTGLLERRRAALSKYVYEWVHNNPQLAVPVDYHTGINQPFADGIDEFCQQAPDPQECAKSAGVDSDD